MPFDETSVTPPRAGIYVSSRASRFDRVMMWRNLRAKGWPIISSWIDLDGDVDKMDFGAIWCKAEEEIARSAGLVLYAETHDFPLKGAHTEGGIAIAHGIPIFAVLPGLKLELRQKSPVPWIYHPRVRLVSHVETAFQLIVGDLDTTEAPPEPPTEPVSMTAFLSMD